MNEKATADKFLEKGNEFYNLTEWDRALECWEKSRDIYEEFGDKQGISYALNNIGLVYQDKGEWERAHEFYEKSLKIVEELKDKQGISDTLGNLGNVYQDKGEWERALKYYEKSLKIKEKLDEKQGISHTLSNLGNVYQNKGEWERALKYYEKSLKISEEVGNERGISNTLNNLGAVYQNKGEWERALKYYEKSLKISEEVGDKKGISYALNNIGSLYQNNGEWESALKYYEKSLKIKEKLDEKQGISHTLSNIGSVYQNKGEWERALKYYEKSLKISEEVGDERGISNTLGNIGELQIKNGNWDEAKKNLNRALEISEKLAPIFTLAVLTNLGELFRLEENYKDSFTILDKATNIVVQVGLKSQEIDIYEKLGDTHLDQYIASKIEDNLLSAEKFYIIAHKIAKSFKMTLQEATAIRGIGVVQAKKGDLAASKKSFMNAIEILRRLGARYELQKTLLEYAKVLYETNVLIEAEMVAKTSAFDALRYDYQELLVKLYLLLGDIEMRKEDQFEYYLDALKASEFNPKIYVRTCFILIYRMKTMEKQTLLRFIESLKEVNKNRDKYFNQFLEALDAKIDGKEYDTSSLPASLKKEIEKF